MSDPYMTDRLVEVIQELRDYLGPKAYGLSDEDVTCAGRWTIRGN